MSTVNPDDRERRIGRTLQPVIVTAALLVQLLAPGFALATAFGILDPDGWLIAVYVAVWVVVGLAALALPSGRNPYLLAIFMLAYVGGLFVTMQLAQDGQLGLFGILLIVAAYGVAVLLLALHLLREAAVRRTREIGVDTVATVLSAPVTGMVNYVPRQRLTLRFTDRQGVERFVRVGRTGGRYSAGDTLPLRYDPTRPGSRRGILVDGSGPRL